MALLGNAYVSSGRISEGMTLLDQAMAAVAAGEVRGVGAAGEIYCRLLAVCERATDVRRAEQWLEAATRFEAWSDFVPPTCRTHSGGILIALGRWEEAERELLAAVRRFETAYRASRLDPLLRLAELCVRQGRLEEAERLLEGFDWNASAKRSLGRIALARGDLALAQDLVRLCLESTPPPDPDRLQLLGLLVEVQLAPDELSAAEETLAGLVELAADSQDERKCAVVMLAHGRVRAARGDEQARADLQAAVELFSGLGLRLEAAQARVLLARALAWYAPAAAVVEARQALETDDLLLDVDVAHTRRNVESMLGLVRCIAGARRLGYRREVVLGERWRALMTPTLLIWPKGTPSDRPTRVRLSPRRIRIFGSSGLPGQGTTPGSTTQRGSSD